jgi:RNA-directed DNA polymerase
VSIRLTADDVTLKADFARLINFSDVAKVLEVRPRILKYYLRRSGNYKEFELHKRSGGTRTIFSPVNALKIIQRKLNQILHAVYGARSPVHGFVRKKSIVTNAAKHLEREFILSLDLEDFFPSIHFGRVKGLFTGKPYNLPENVAVTLAQICCHNTRLPAGAPTSPIVSNMICAQMDSELKRFAIDFGCTYTRYADDITFSVRRGPFPPVFCHRDTETRKAIVGDEITRIISSNSFKINVSKTRLLPRGNRQEVTGLVVGTRVNVNRRYLRHVRAMLHAAERYGVEAAAKDFVDRKQRLRPATFERILRGKIEFVGSVRGRDDGIYFRLIRRYLKLVPTARSRRIIVGPTASMDVLGSAIWLLEGASNQGTAFAADGLDLVTAAHVIAPDVEASSPTLQISGVPVKALTKDDHVDVANVYVNSHLPVQLRIGSSADLRIGDRIKILGFPLHRVGGAVNIQNGTITSYSPWFGVPHFVVDGQIVHGNSGGPILNERNEVVGIAVRGQGIPGRVGNGDELSRFVPIDAALPRLRPPISSD